MRALHSGRLTLAVLVLTMLSVPGILCLGGLKAIASEDLRTCLKRESAAFYGKLAAAVLSSAIDASKIDDHFIATATESIVETCKQITGQANADDIAAFSDYMAKWSAHLDRKLGELSTLGGGD